MELVWWMQGVNNHADNQGLEGQIKEIDDKTKQKNKQKDKDSELTFKNRPS